MTQHTKVEQKALLPREPDERLGAVRSWPDEAAQVWTLDLVQGASRNRAIEAIIASGSAVRDVECSDDLDLVLVYREDRPGLPRPPMTIDLRQYERADVKRKLAGRHDYLSWTVRYGQVLFERDGWWTRLRAHWNSRLMLPSVAEAQERARKAERLYDQLREVGDRDAADDVRISMLTHLARAALSSARVFPKSRPELAGQLRSIGEQALADSLAEALARRCLH